MKTSHNLIKVIFLINYILCHNLIFAQNSILTIKDSQTNEVIPSVYVSVFKENQSYETISNTDGKFKVPIQFDSIKFSHVAYEVLIKDNSLPQQGIVYLAPKSVLLGDIKVYNLDLKEKIAFVLRNFNRLYVTGSRTYQCTYKGTQRIDNKLSRLVQFRLNWWNKNYNSNLKKSVLSQNRLSIGETDYAQKGQLDKGEFIESTSFLSSLLLNSYLTGLLNSIDEIVIDHIEKDQETSTVFFSAKYSNPSEKYKSNFNNNEVRFDSKTGAIILLKTHLVYEDRVEKGTSRKTNEPYEIQYNNENRKMSFIKEGGKLRLAELYLKLNINKKSQGKIKNFEDQGYIYVTKIEKGNKIPKKEYIDLTDNNNIFDYIGEKVSDDPKILFTDEESRFIHFKDKED
jgi:hypothetical protein